VTSPIAFLVKDSSAAKAAKAANDKNKMNMLVAISMYIFLPPIAILLTPSL
jgi:hypothetical protein